MTKFIVHIGDGKCGSSAIQAALFDAVPELKKKRVIYASHHRTSGNFCFGTLLGKPTRGNDARQRELAIQTVEKLKAQLKGADFVIISSEAFLTLAPDEVLQILRMIDPSPERVDLIAYVRAPVGMYLSLAQQSIKASARFPAPDKYVRHLDKFLLGFEQHPNVDSLTVRMFDRTQLVNSNAVSDFEHILRSLTDNPEISLNDVDENSSLSSEQMVVLQDFRSRFCRDIEGKAAPQSSRLIDFFSAMNEEGLIGSKPTLSDAAASLVGNNNSEIVQRLNDRYGLSLACPTAKDIHKMPANWGPIGSILKGVKKDYVEHLKMLIPNYNPGILSGDSSEDKNALRRMIALEPAKAEAIERATQTYWTAESLSNLVET